jgi:tripartite-type tricarboxylate transporter receptor subunit TctC
MNTKPSRRRVLQLAAASALGLPAVGRAQAAPMRMIVSWPAGGVSDSTARLLVERLTPVLKRQINVENRPGAGGQIGAGYFKGLPPDGDAVLFGSINETMLSAITYKKLSYQPLTDLLPVTTLFESPSVLAVPASGHASMTEFFAWAKENPKKVAIGCPGLATPMYFHGLILGAKLGFEANMIPFAGGAPHVTALAGGQVMAGLNTFGPDFIGMHNGGKIKILGFTSEKRNPMPQFRNVPTFTEVGLPTIPDAWFGLFLPVGARPETVQTWNKAVAEVLAREEVRTRLADFGLTPRSSTPQEFSELIRRETGIWTDIVKSTGFEPIS